MKKCKCKKQVITTNFCPDCGENQRLLPQKYPVEGMFNQKTAIKTKEYRNPLKGEYYLSGAIPMAYKAFHDLGTKYWIAEIDY